MSTNATSAPGAPVALPALHILAVSAAIAWLLPVDTSAPMSAAAPSIRARIASTETGDACVTTADGAVVCTPGYGVAYEWGTDE